MSAIIQKKENGKIEVTFLSDWSKLESYLNNLKEQGKEFVVSSPNIDNLFFDAYDFDAETGAIINISDAKQVWINHYRKARTPLLAALDLEYMRADEDGNLELKKEIAAKKQALRDVTKTDLPNTLEEIKATWPEILGEKP